jgi:transcriptional regulator with XRE-family HTH domain
MNNYLVFIGSNISEMRRILNLTQEDLSKMMGVSRPTIVKLEQDPDKMTKALAFALFGAIAIDIKKRLKDIKSINPNDYRDIDRIGLLIEQLKTSSSLSISSMGTIATFGLGKMIPGIGSLVSSGLKNGWKTVKDKTITNIKENVQWDIKKAELIIESVERKLSEDEKKLLECFNLESFQIELFGEEMEKGEESDYELWGK